jgi:hypothetical protein
MSASSHHAEQALASTPERLSFLGVVSAPAGGLISAAPAVPLVRFAASALRDSAEDASWSDVGTVDEFRSLGGEA